VCRLLSFHRVVFFFPGALSRVTITDKAGDTVLIRLIGKRKAADYALGDSSKSQELDRPGAFNPSASCPDKILDLWVEILCIKWG
jgi:hypothetical protein